MNRPRLPRLGLAVLGAALLLACVGGRAAFAAPEDAGSVTFAVASDPERVAAGEKGVLVLTGTIRKGLRVFADQRFQVTPVAAAGVTYGQHETSKPTAWRDPSFPDDPPADVFLDRVVVRIPFEIAAGTALPVSVGATVKWSACDEDQCFPPETKGPLTVEVKGPPVKGPPEAPPAPAPVPAPTEPTPPVPSEPAVPEPAPPPPAPAPVRPAFDVSVVHPAAEAKVTVRATEKEFAVLFEPAAGHHLYAVGHTGGESAVAVKGVPAPGVVWFDVVAPAVESTEVSAPYEVRLPYTDDGDGKSPIEVLVSWQACLDSGTCRPPEPPHRFTVDRGAKVVTIVEAPPETPAPMVPAPAAVPVSTEPAPGAAPAPPSTPVATSTAGPVAPTGLLFPVLGERPKETAFRDWLVLVTAFLSGMALSLTPCVLPILPITVSIIGGGRADLSRGRLTFLLLCYVLGLTLTFGSMGVVAGLTGGSLSAAFQSPVAIWVIAALFAVLSLGMFGIYELQPPAAIQRLQGGAKGGSPIGAFLFGAVAAVLASPCTGPFIAGALVYIAASASSVLKGFLVFAAIGLGMGTVLFAAGSLNLLLRPGPWMVWVRHVFGVLMIGAALYYLASSGKLVPPALFGVGFLVAVAVAAGIVRHLVRKEGEALPHAASQAAKVAVMIAVATGAVALLTRHAPSGEALPWTTVTSREQLVAEVEKAEKEGQATVVDVWATWCTYCRKYDDVIEDSPQLRQEMGRLRRLRIDVTERPAWEAGLREALGIPRDTQPFMVFLDGKGRILRALDVTGWLHGDAEPEVLRRAREAQG